ncbi:response regulator transcription factor [Candidatus Nitrosacidococcus tergens]|uniref:Transcriptional regulatory protein tctD n=1 Tax=Candidatus Nitrosacidococcus tergens TaxID=553981 RepID=A0A7G1Q916_9GAMM|nr:response regulator transcription factor [Candidatus Nitrosacidococcus tergens]CAB1275539.1 Transcriptional regulatory protein tctD [Candidatus Nitrosacidococcus tergens]
MKILLAEDDVTLADGLTQALSQVGYEVINAMTGTYADTALYTQEFDLVILDLNLPGLSGNEVIKNLRGRKNAVPVLVLTARNGLDDRINSLEYGADDYMSKPFELKELEVRIRALIRRSYGGFHHITIGNLTLDIQTRQIYVNGKVESFSSREYAVLEILFLHLGKVVSKDKIAQRLSIHGEILGDNAIEVYIHRLRKRLALWGINIRTLRGLGYLLEKDSNDTNPKS